MIGLRRLRVVLPLASSIDPRYEQSLQYVRETIQRTTGAEIIVEQQDERAVTFFRQ